MLGCGGVGWPFAFAASSHRSLVLWSTGHFASASALDDAIQVYLPSGFQMVTMAKTVATGLRSQLCIFDEAP